MLQLPSLTYYRFFYGYLGNRVLLALLFSLLVAVLDGFGLAMFLPLLQSVSEAGGTPGAGEFDFLLAAMQGLGISTGLTGVLFAMLFFFVLKGGARFCLEYYRMLLQQRFISSLRLQCYRLLSGSRYEHFSRAHSGTIQNALSGEVVSVNHAYVSYFQMLQYLIMTVVYTILAYAANPGFAVLVVAGGVLSNLAFNRINKLTQEASGRLSGGTNDFQGFVIESVSSFKFLKATGLLSRYTEKVRRSVEDIQGNQRKIGQMNAISAAAREPIIMLVVVTAVLIQVTVFGEALELLILSLLFFYRALTSVMAVQGSYNHFLSVSGSVQNVRSFIQELEGVQEPVVASPYGGLRQGIRVTGLTYGFADRKLLEDLSFEIRKFETVGIVGESGSGKTTLANLLCGLLHAPEKSIWIDGTDITDLNKAAFRSRVGYITQEPHVFSDTIRHNVTFWEPPSAGGDAAVWASLTAAHAASFVRELPDGLDTKIGINGVNLSGGQRQRLALARELYRKVELLILDEATSALDSQSEKLIQENIGSLAGSLTMIVIAHRLSTIRKADKIIFLKSAGDYEVGSFADLHQRSTKFRKMVELQAF